MFVCENKNCDKEAVFDAPARLCNEHWQAWWYEGIDEGNPELVAERDRHLELAKRRDLCDTEPTKVFKQSTPRAVILTCLDSIEGEISNLEEQYGHGPGGPDKRWENLYEKFEDIKSVLRLEDLNKF